MQEKIPEGKYVISCNKMATAALLFGHVVLVLTAPGVNVNTKITVYGRKTHFFHIFMGFVIKQDQQNFSTGICMVCHVGYSEMCRYTRTLAHRHLHTCCFV
jgi:hypothetical protein